MRPPQMGQMGRGMPNAFSGNPQFQQQLAQMMALQPFNAPRVGMPINPQSPSLYNGMRPGGIEMGLPGGQFGGFGASGGTSGMQPMGDQGLLQFQGMQVR